MLINYYLFYLFWKELEKNVSNYLLVLLIRFIFELEFMDL